ncbi:MAG: ABC transporter ATP-binding protein [Candidatus Binatia bacterium]
MVSTFRKCLLFLSPHERWRWAGLIPLAVCAALAEALGAGAVFGLIKIIGDPAQAATLPVVSVLVAWLPRRDPQTLTIATALAVALLYVFKNAVLIIVAARQSAVACESTVALSVRMFERYLAAPFVFHLSRNSAELIRNTTTSVETMCALVMMPAINVLVEGLIVTGIAAVLLMTAPPSTWVAAGALFALLAAVLRLTRRALLRWGEEEHGLRQAIIQNLQQSLGGLKDVRLRGREPFFHALFADQQRNLARVRHSNIVLSTASRLLIESVFIVGMLLMIALLAVRGNAGPQVVPVLGLYAYAGFRVIPSVNRILLNLNCIRYASPTVERLHEDFVALGPPPQLSEAAQAETITFADRIELQHVSYAYDARRPPVLHDVSLAIRRGESVGIVGPTGSGKSTLIDIVLGLLAPSAGRVTLDGRDLASARRAWQRKIGYVPQSVHLTDDTLRRNVAFGLRDDEIEPARVDAAVRLAQLEPFITSLPQGLDTHVGERGVRLSGGERQRVAIARALYHEPELLVFDEATASLDAQTERELTGAIEALHGRKTMLIIAHRLSTVRKCDRLVFLRDGRVAGVGSFDELFERNLDFRSMASAAFFVAPTAQE